MAFYQRALDMESSNTNVMDALAEVCMQLGDLEKAHELLLRSTEAAPSVNPFKWLYLAQLQGEEGALASYTRGIEELTALGANTDTDEVFFCVLFNCTQLLNQEFSLIKTCICRIQLF
jgi:predicted Zn-dependent protease